MLSIIFVLGLIWGSFLNVCIHRIPRNELSIFFPYRSLCPNCRETVRFYDNIPLFSYLMLNGKCRYCQWLIPIRYFGVELGTALSLVFLVICYQSAWDQSQAMGLARAFILLSLLIPISLIDCEKYIVPNQLVIVGLIVGLAINLVDSIIKQNFFVLGQHIFWGLMSGLGLQSIAIIGKVALGRTAMGFGDVKLMVVLGLFLGRWQSMVLVLMGAAISGASIGTIALIWRRDSDRSRLPVAPFLSFAAMIDLIWHQQIWSTYLRLVGWTL